MKLIMVADPVAVPVREAATRSRPFPMIATVETHERSLRPGRRGGTCRDRQLMGVLLALGSAVCYGLADFAGGMVARRMNYALVALLGQLGGLIATVLASVLLATATIRASDVGWGALSGVGTGVGMVFLYRAMSRGAMSVAVPVSAVTGVALPVLVGVAAIGDRPSVPAWVGILVGLPALWLVSRRPADSSSGVRLPVDALIAGVGIAGQYLALAHPAAAAGLWPLAAGRAAAAVTVLPLVGRSGRDPGGPRVGLVVAALATGTLPAAALALYAAATREQLLTIAVVLSSLYPVIPVVLGITVLRERPSRLQIIGFLAAGAAVVLITLG
ncbi:MAG: DMT family transporter [Microlunatus sp.]|nr:DMT family transporter [Microlunatus sp.]